MALIHLYLNIDGEYILFLRDLYKIITILIVLQLILYFAEIDIKMIHNAFTGKVLLNNDFFVLLFIVLISMSSYYLVFAKLLAID
jgi:hypothetical protein